HLGVWAEIEDLIAFGAGHLFLAAVRRRTSIFPRDIEPLGDRLDELGEPFPIPLVPPRSGHERQSPFAVGHPRAFPLADRVVERDIAVPTDALKSDQLFTRCSRASWQSHRHGTFSLTDPKNRLTPDRHHSPRDRLLHQASDEAPRQPRRGAGL